MRISDWSSDVCSSDLHVFKVGQYKSAVEPFTRDDASPEAKEADLYWMNDVWQRYLADVAKVRKLTPARLVADIDNLPAGIEAAGGRSEEHTSELQSLMRISYAVFCLQKKKNTEYNTRPTVEL